MKLAVTKLKRRIAELEAFDPQSVNERFAPEVTALQAAIEEALAAAFGHETPEYRRYEGATRLDHGPLIMGRDDTPYEVHQYLTDGKRRAILLLQQAIRGLEEEIDDRASREAAVVSITTVATPRPRKVFVVHGHSEAREAAARLLERLGFEAIILQEKPNEGRTVIEKVEAHSDVGFAVVILTPDDEGCLKGEPLQPRARQNVVLELGYFVGRLGRKNVCALKAGNLEMPSDLGGVVCEPFDASGSWKMVLGRELKAAEFEIDWNQVFG
jgi:predicted nucleotide-binding protein